MNKSGLSYFQDGGATDTDIDSDSAAPLTKPVQAKGRFAVATPAGAVPMNESILENMQRILQEKQSRQGSLLENLKDARAAFTGYGLENAQAIDLRRKEREQEAQDIFNIQNQLAQYKTAQQQLAKVRAADAASGWGPAGAAPAAGATSAPTVASGFSKDVVDQYNRILETEGIGAANKFKNEQLKISSQYNLNPQLDQIVEFPVNGQLESMTLRQAKVLAERDPRLKALLERTVPGSTTSTAPAAAPVQNAPAAAPAQNAPVVSGSGQAAPVAPAAPKAAAPAAPVSSGVTTGGGARSATAIKNELEIQKQIESKRGEERVVEEEKRLSNLIDQSKKAVDRADTASRINAIAEADPEMFGVLVKPGVTSSLGTLLKEGIKVGTHGQIALPSIEDIVRRNDPRATPEKLSRAREMEGYLRKVELDFSSAFKGQGAVSDNERRIVQAIAGSTSDPADLLRKKAAWMTMSAEKDKALGQAWRDFQAANGQNVAFSRFENSPQYRQIVQNHEQRLKQQFEKEVSAYGNRPLISAEEYDKGGTKPSTSRRTDLLNKYTTK